MSEPAISRFHIDQPVRAARDLLNDGSHPGSEVDTLLVPAGVGGRVLRVGRHEDSGLAVYLVDFEGCLLGCIDDDLVVAERPGVL